MTQIKRIYTNFAVSVLTVTELSVENVVRVNHITWAKAQKSRVFTQSST